MFEKVKKLYDKGKKAGGILKKVYTIYKTVFNLFEYDAKLNILTIKFYVLSSIFDDVKDTEKIEDNKNIEEEKEQENDKNN